MSGEARRSADEPVGTSGAPRSANLLEWLFELRDRQRAHQGKGAWLIKGQDLAWERNRQGRMKWYLHPALDDTAIRSLIVFVQEIPPGGRSGVQKTPGGSILYILQGRGYTLLDGVRHDWQAADCVNIPIRTNGVVVQHVNSDPHHPAAFLSVDLNLVDVLGVDRGAEFEQLEAAPEVPGE